MKKTLIISGSNSELAIGVINNLLKKYEIVLIYHSKKPKFKYISPIILAIVVLPTPGGPVITT